MKCLRCLNTDPKYFYEDHGVYYCRKCVGFSRMDVNEKVRPVHLSQKALDVSPQLEYSLTESQKRISHEILNHLRSGKDVFVYAATGAGKTECTFESICAYLKEGKKVVFAISRRQVVLEIAQRLRKAFPTLSIVEVTQGYTSITDGDLIVCTNHQLYRYPYAVDLLIMDEVDAFPYVGNNVLQSIAHQACRGQIMYLSATPDSQSQKEIEEGKMEMVCLFERPHKHPLAVPKVWVLPVFLQVCVTLYYCRLYASENKQVLVFVPRKQDCLWLSKLLRCPYIHSSVEEKDEIMDRFRNKAFPVLVTTTLLERGITVPSVQVIVCMADHIVFTTASLIQIFGRVGRSFQDPKGDALCLCQFQSASIKECVRQVEWMNAHV